MTTSETAGSAEIQGHLWSARARDFAEFEPKMLALYESALDAVATGPGERLLDVGCGAGLLLRLAAARGAEVAGMDAAHALVEIARERLPGVDVAVGEMEDLPYEDDSFGVVTGFNSFQFAADPSRALREAGRVARPGAPVVVATWGRPEQCEGAAWVAAIGSLLPPPPPDAPGPFALSEDGALEAFAERGGLRPDERREVLCVWDFPDEATMLRGFMSTGFAVRAIGLEGEERVAEVLREAIAPFRTSAGGYRLENVFAFLVAHAPGAHATGSS